MSVQVVAAKMAEVELNDIPTKELAPVSLVTPKAEDKGLNKNEPNPVASTSSLAPPVETVRGDPSPSPTPCPNPVKMPQASAMKRTDAQQNGEAFLNRDGTVAEAPRMKKVGRKFNNSLHPLASLSCLFL